MKCIKCNVKEGANPWHLTTEDFKKRGVNANRFDLLDCFCVDCATSGCWIELLDNYLFLYWQKLNQTQTELQQDHDLTEKLKKHYYKWHPAIECVKVSQHFSSNLGQALQYIWRSETLNPNAVTKGQSIDEIVKDLEKAQAFIQFEIDRLRGN